MFTISSIHILLQAIRILKTNIVTQPDMDLYDCLTYLMTLYKGKMTLEKRETFNEESRIFSISSTFIHDSSLFLTRQKMIYRVKSEILSWTALTRYLITSLCIFDIKNTNLSITSKFINWESRLMALINRLLRKLE